MATIWTSFVHSVLADKKGHIGKVTDINKNNYITEIFFNFLTNKSQNIEM